MGDTSAASGSRQEGHPTAPSHRTGLEGAGLTPAATASAMTAPSRTAISLTVNGVRHRVNVEDRWTLVELLRDIWISPGPKSAATAANVGPAPC
jgi:hypothetical protein